MPLVCAHRQPSVVVITSVFRTGRNRFSELSLIRDEKPLLERDAAILIRASEQTGAARDTRRRFVFHRFHHTKSADKVHSVAFPFLAKRSLMWRTAPRSVGRLLAQKNEAKTDGHRVAD